MDHEAGQGQHCCNTQGSGFWRCLCPLPPNSSREEEMQQQGKGIGAPDGARGEATRARGMQEGLGGITSRQPRAGLLQAGRQRYLFFFNQLVSYGGGGGGREEAEQIVILGLREAESWEGAGDVREGAPQGHLLQNTQSRQASADGHTKALQETSSTARRHLGGGRARRPGYHPPYTRILREDVQTASACQASPPACCCLSIAPFTAAIAIFEQKYL